MPKVSKPNATVEKRKRGRPKGTKAANIVVEQVKGSKRGPKSEIDKLPIYHYRAEKCGCVQKTNVHPGFAFYMCKHKNEMVFVKATQS